MWSATRDEHLATIGAHRVAWAVLNLGFGFATIATAAGLAILALAADPDGARAAALTAVALAYAVGGALWCAVLAVRARTTPALADLVRDGRPTEPGETLLGAAQGGLFAAFVVVTCAALVGLGLTLLITGGVDGRRRHRDRLGSGSRPPPGCSSPAISSRPCCTCPRC